MNSLSVLWTNCFLCVWLSQRRQFDSAEIWLWFSFLWEELIFFVSSLARACSVWNEEEVGIVFVWLSFDRNLHLNGKLISMKDIVKHSFEKYFQWLRSKLSRNHQNINQWIVPSMSLMSNHYYHYEAFFFIVEISILLLRWWEAHDEMPIMKPMKWQYFNNLCDVHI